MARETIYGFIAAEKATYPVRLLCRVLQVSTSAFYDWIGRGRPAVADTDLEDANAANELCDAWAEHRRTYGARRLTAEIRDRGQKTWADSTGRTEERVGRVAEQARESAQGATVAVGQLVRQGQDDALRAARLWTELMTRFTPFALLTAGRSEVGARSERAEEPAGFPAGAWAEGAFELVETALSTQRRFVDQVLSAQRQLIAPVPRRRGQHRHRHPGRGCPQQCAEPRRRPNRPPLTPTLTTSRPTACWGRPVGRRRGVSRPILIYPPTVARSRTRASSILNPELTGLPKITGT